MQDTVSTLAPFLPSAITAAAAVGGALGAQYLGYRQQRKLKREEIRREEHREAYRKYHRLAFRVLTYDWSSVGRNDEATSPTAYSELIAEMMDTKVEFDLLIVPPLVRQKAKALEQAIDKIIQRAREANNIGALSEDYTHDEEVVDEVRELQERFLLAVREDVGLHPHS